MKRQTKTAASRSGSSHKQSGDPCLRRLPVLNGVVGALLSLLPMGIIGLVGCAQFPSLPGPVGGHSLANPIAPQQAKTPIRTPAKLPITEQAKVCLTTAREMEKGNKYKEAIHFYDQTRRKDPRQKHVCHRMAVLHDKLGEFTKAEEEYGRALALTPDDPELLADIGYSFYSQGRWKAAETYSLKALKIDPKHRRAWVNLGLALGQQKRYGESLGAFQKAVTPAQAYCNLAFIYRTQKQDKLARAAYEKSLDIHPNFRPALDALARMERTKDKNAPRVVAKQQESEPKQSPFERLKNFRREWSQRLAQQTPDEPQPEAADSSRPGERVRGTQTRGPDLNAQRRTPQTSQQGSLEWEAPTTRKRSSSTFADDR